MTEQIKRFRPVLIVMVFILTAILLIPAIAFAESETEPVAGSVDSTTQSSLETSLSDPVCDPSPEEPSSDSPDSPSLEPSTESAPLESDPVEENSADSELNSPGVIDESTSQTYAEEPVDPLPAEGDCYVATITPDAVIDGLDDYTDGSGNSIPNSNELATFTVTFTETGAESIGSARVDIPAGFTSIVYDTDWTTTGISTNDGQVWEGKRDGMFIYLRAFDAAQLLYKDDYVSVTFQAVTPVTTGIYEFETRAWTDITADFNAAGTNDMADGYIDPVVIVGTPVGTDLGLSSVSCNLAGHYVQVADIDLIDYSYCSGWNPIGSSLTPFSGSYNGNGYTITNLTINRPTESEVGLFGFTNLDSFFTNMKLEGVNINGNNYCGALIGANEGGTITNCYILTGNVNGSDTGEVQGGLVGYNLSGKIINCKTDVAVSGGNYVGGLIGYNHISTVINSNAKGTVTGDYYVGGLIGNNRISTVTNSHAKGVVTGDDRVGGLVGHTYFSTITSCYATGAVTGDDRVGGLVGSCWLGNISYSYASGAVNGSNNRAGGLAGQNQEGTITDCYASGAVTGNFNVGGLVGHNRSGGIIIDSYAAGAVTGISGVGGLVGNNEVSTITDCYYDRETTGQSDNDGRGVPKTTTEMRDIATFSGWDIVTLNNFNPDALPGDSDFHVWYIDQGKDYPRLWWQYEAPGGGDSWSFSGDGNYFDMSWFTMQMLGLPKPEGLVFGSYPYITLQFVERGSRDQTAEVREAYGQFLQAFELKKDRLSAGEHARQSIELAIAWAAILAREAALAANAGQAFDLGAVISAYRAAAGLLASHGHYLTGYQLAYANEILNALAAVIKSLGGPVV